MPLSAGLDRFVSDSYGYEAPGLDRLKQEEIALTNLAGVMAEPMAEQVFAYLLAIERNLSTAVRKQDRREWGGFGPDGEIYGKTIGIVGVGSAGSRVAEYAKAFDMTVIGTKQDTSSVTDAVDDIYNPADLDAVLPRSDYLVVACPLTDETRGLIGVNELDELPDDAVVVNIGRGAVLNQDALVTALEDGMIRAAGLDVFDPEPLPEDSPLWERDNVILTPHYAGGSPRTGERTAQLFARNYEKFLADESEEFENRVV